MLSMEDILCELNREELNEQGLPPGFRFHPTDEELITFYLASKVFNGTFCGIQIAEVDLNRCEPWELPEVAKMGEREWYFFSLRDRKYPTGLRTNRATGAGYWKATGKDREVYSATNGALLGMKKTLVFYKGRAPKGEKTKWVMHEYRLDGDFSYRYSSKEEWVICRIVHKVGEKKNINGILYDEGGGDVNGNNGGEINYYEYPTLKTWSSAALNTANPKTTTLWQQQQQSHNHLYLFHHHINENDLIKSISFFNNNNTSFSFSSSPKRYKDDHVDTNNKNTSSNILLINQQICTSSSSTSSKKMNETMLKTEGTCCFSPYANYGMNTDWSSSMEEAGMIPCNFNNNIYG